MRVGVVMRFERNKENYYVKAPGVLGTDLTHITYKLLGRWQKMSKIQSKEKDCNGIFVNAFGIFKLFSYESKL